MSARTPELLESAAQTMPVKVADLAGSYAYCREVARREAKNFYYSFVALPQAKRDAMCAVYAFMRKADDLCDDESKSLEQRRIELADWVARWHQADRVQVENGAPEDLIFPALVDTKARFNIPSQLLDQLIAGTAMDLNAATRTEGSFDTYATFADLYQYCYLVASVVGLVCIRIFGYQDSQAESLAEQTGIAFPTNEYSSRRPRGCGEASHLSSAGSAGTLRGAALRNHEAGSWRAATAEASRHAGGDRTEG